MRLFNADGSRVGGVGQRRPRPGRAAAARRRAGRRRRSRFRPTAGVKRLDAHRARRIAADVPRGDGPAGRPASGRRSIAAGETLQRRRDDVRQPAVRRARPAAGRSALPAAGAGARASRDLPGADQRRVRARRSADVGAHSDLGARRRSDAVVGDRVVRVADCRGGVRRRGRGPPRSSRPAARSASSGASDSVYLTGWAEVLFDGDWLRR